MPETNWHAVKTSATLDNNFLRKIPREKFRTKINTPRARENVRQLGVVTLVQHTAGRRKLLGMPVEQ
jgi:hypothetical protein